MEELKHKYITKLIEIKRKLEKGEKDEYGSYYDKEAAHVEADRVLCDLLRELGFEEVVAIYESIPKTVYLGWYYVVRHNT